MRTCTKCEQEKPESEFSLTKKSADGIHHICKACHPSKDRRRPDGYLHQRGDGYVYIIMRDHPRARGGRVLQHIVVAEKAIGRYLPIEVEIHHFDEIKSHNENSNLVICENGKYHELLHVRQRVLAAGGDPNTQKICATCQKVKSRSDFYANVSTGDGLTPACKACHISETNGRRSRKAIAKAEALSSN